MSAPLVSVIITTYNRWAYLREAIRSVMAQTYANIELIVVDDGSTDETQAEVAKWDVPLRYERIAHSGKPSVGRNRGLALARGKYVAFLDDDDLWLPEKLQRQVDYLEGRGDYAFVYCDVRFLYPDGSLSPPVLLEAQKRQGDVFEALLSDCFIFPSALMLRRDCLADLGGFDESLNIGEDYDFWLRLAYHGAGGCVDMPLVQIRRHSANISLEREYAIYRNTAVVLERVYRGFPLRADQKRRLRRSLAGMHVLAAEVSRKSGFVMQALEHDLRAVRSNPFRLRPWVGLLTSGMKRLSAGMGVVFTGHLIRQVLGLVSSVLLARGLGPRGLGVFAVIGSAMMIAGTVADFGLSNSAVRLIAGERKQNPLLAQQTTQVFAQFKMLAALLLFAVLLGFSGTWGDLLHLPPESGGVLLLLGALGLVAAAMSGVVGTVLRALQRFRAMVMMQVTNVLLTVLIVAGLYLGGLLTVETALLVGVFGAGGAAVLGYRLLPQRWRPSLRQVRQSWRQAAAARLLGFSKWMWISAVFSILLAQLDLILLNRALPAAQVGFYALALNLALKADLVNQTQHTVLLPAASELSHRREYLRYLRRNLLRSSLLAVGMLALLPLARPFILALYGAAFAPSVGVFYALMSVVFFDLFAAPNLLLAFPLDIPQWIVLSDVIGVVLLVLGASFFIPLWGVFGVVAAKLLGKVAAALLLGVVIHQRVRLLSRKSP